ncbi:MAG: phospholipid carrier-dependent glycosyltransferase, partial [Chloroflexota bacterium]
FSVVLIYTLARQLFRDRSIALLSALFLLTDGLMFSEARIGTNDIFQLGFLLAAYNAFVLYLRRPARSGLSWLALTGFLLGLAFASKWPAVFSIGLLASIAVVRGLWPHRDPALVAKLPAAALASPDADGPPDTRRARAEPAHTPTANGPGGAVDGLEWAEDGISVMPGVRAPGMSFAPWDVPARLWYLAASLCSLVLLPIGLYVLSYLQMYLQPHHIPLDYAQIGPFHIGPLRLGPATLASSNWWNMFVGEQWQMWHYHTTLKDHHPYYSAWWQWLLDIRPVFYYVHRAGDTVANTYALGNPLLYWVFPLGIVAGVILMWRRRQPWLALVLAALAVNWLPWTHSPRGLFFYHFLPSVPFLVLLMAYGIVALYRRPETLWRCLAIAYSAAVFLGFAFFYTQLSAWPVPNWWADLHYWLPSWQ